MCGIAGILRLTPPGELARAALERSPFDAIPEVWLDKLDESIRHRGPDGQGRFRDRAVRADGTVVDVALVHRRLSIIDHGGGAQPMVSQRARADGTPAVREGSVGFTFRPLLFHGKPDAPVHYEQLPDVPDTLAVVFNGCIYNHRELRRELEAVGHRFVTDHSDTEVLLHGWREWKYGLARRLDGMFAQLIWDRAAASTLLQRDAAGEKPLNLFEAGSDGTLFVASSVAASSAAAVQPLGSGDSLRADALEISRWINFGFSGKAPILGARVVPPGSTLVATVVMPNESSAPREFFIQRGLTVRPMRSERSTFAAERVDELIQAAVESRLECDVALGCFLSGGVDSSLIAHYARRSLGNLQTFSVRMPDKRFDESEFARSVAGHIGSEHHELPCEMEPAHDLVRLIQEIGLPLGDSSLLPSYWVSRAAARHVKVALGGDGGDEMFCGYVRYRAARVLQRHQLLLRRLPKFPLSSPDPRSFIEKARRFLEAARGEGYTDLLRLFSHSEARTLGVRFPSEMAPAFPAWDSPQCVSDEPWEVRKSPRGLNWWWGGVDAPRWDFAFYLPNDLMCKVDSASMSSPIEVRAPFLSKALVDACLAEPLASLMPRGQRKGLLRAVARRHLPAHIVDRPKMGFAIPIGEWFRSDYGGLRTLLLDHMNSAEPFGPPSLGIDLNMTYVRQMLDEHLGTGKSGLVTRDHSQRLYMLLVLSIWARWLGSLR